MIAGILVPGFDRAYAIHSKAASDTTKVKSQTKITDTRTNKPAYLKNGVRVNFVPFEPNKDKTFGNITSVPLPKQEDNVKILNNVKVYPNPISDQLNLTYSINRDSNVTIKIMDVLGNEITTLFTQRLTAGEQTNSFNITSKLTSGFYFIRVSVGSEIITKRISIL